MQLITNTFHVNTVNKYIPVVANKHLHEHVIFILWELTPK